MAQQIGVSVLATLGATAVLAGIAAWRTPHPGTPAAPPGLVSGGKFAARAADDGDANALVTLIDLPLVLPMFTAPAVPALDAGATAVPDGLSPASLQAPTRLAATRLAHVAARADSRRSETAIPLPPRRAQEAGGAIVMAAVPDRSAASPVDASLWTDVAGAYGKAAQWSGAVLDRLIP